MIQTNHLSYSYIRKRKTLNDINLRLEDGHIYGLLGKNGVGKSTLLKLLTGALRGEGDCSIDGLDPRQRPAELLEKFRLVPENEAIPETTILALAEVCKRLYPNFSEETLQKALTEFEVPATQRLTKMSLGQQKKSLISLSLACGTKYLFMDEPTNGMDIPSKATFRRIVASALADSEQEQKTVVVSTHQVDDLESLIDAIIIMENEGVLLTATLQEIGQRLCFGEAEEGDEVLYTEQTLHGKRSVMINRTGEEMPVDVKLLFSAVVKNPQKFAAIFKAN